MLWQIGSMETRADPRLHVLRSSMCAGFGAKVEMFRATARRAALRRASRALNEYEAHTSSTASLSKQLNRSFQSSSKLLTASPNPFENLLTASPCHLGKGDLPGSLFFISCTL